MSHIQLRTPPLVLSLLFVLCLVLYLLTIPLPRVDHMLIGSDGVGYYMYVRSLLIDGDLNFRNEFQHFGMPLPPLTATGLVSNQFAIGPALLWGPFFALAHLAALMLNQMGIGVVADGYGYLYQAAIGVASIVYSGAALWLIWRTVARFYAHSALAATILVWFGTNVLYYQIIEPSMSHMCSLFAVSLFLHLWIRWRPAPQIGQWFVLGLSIGLAAVIRQPDGVFLLLPLADALTNRLLWRKPSSLLAGLAMYALGFMAVFSLQMATWFVLYGNPLFSGYFYGGNQGFRWLAPQAFSVLFSLHHGLFLWHPVYLLGVLGLFLLARRDRKLALLLAGGFLLQVYIIGAWSVWWQGDAFGGRMFICTIPIVALGVAALLDWAMARRLAAAAWSLGILLITWNFLFIIQYRLLYIPMADPITFEQLTVGKWWMLRDLTSRIVQRLF